MLRADAVGRTVVWFVDRVSAVESNRVEVEIVKATGAEIREIPSRLLLQGEAVPLRIIFQTERGPRGDVLIEARADLLVDAEVDEPLMGRVDRYGVFTAGGTRAQRRSAFVSGRQSMRRLWRVFELGLTECRSRPLRRAEVMARTCR